MPKPSELFGVALRIIGVVVFIYGIGSIADFFLAFAGYFTLQRTDRGMYVILGVGQLLIGMFLMRGAPGVVDYAYPDEEKTAPETAAAPPDEPTRDNQDGV